MHLKADPSVQRVQMPMRRIPHALKDKFEAELQQMCTDIVYYAVLILYHRESDGTIRVDQPDVGDRLTRRKDENNYCT